LVIDIAGGCEPPAATRCDMSHIGSPSPAQAQVPFAIGSAVFDDAFPGVRAAIIGGGPDQYEVLYEDKAVRCRPSEYLHTDAAANTEAEVAPSWKSDEPETVAARIRIAQRVAAKAADPLVSAATPTDGLCQHNPSPDLETVRLGQEAMARKRRGWEDWVAIAKALQIGRADVMRELHTNEPKGRRYEKAFGDWLVAHAFKEIDKGARSRLLDCLKHTVEIEKWRAGLTDSQRFKFNHPDTVLRKWRASTVVPDPNKPRRPSPVQVRNDIIASLQEEVDRYKAEIERGGGDLWSPEDTPKAIAEIMLLKLSKSKAEKVARAILNALKGAAE
jgi:hypothetical protein